MRSIYCQLKSVCVYECDCADEGRDIRCSVRKIQFVCEMKWHILNAFLTHRTLAMWQKSLFVALTHNL